MLCRVVFTKVAERLFDLLLLLLLPPSRERGGKFSNFVNSTTLDEEFFSEISPSL